MIEGRSIPDRRPRWFAGVRIRKKLLFMHTCFSLGLAALLLLALRAPLREIVRRAEEEKADTTLRMALDGGLSGAALAAAGLRVVPIEEAGLPAEALARLRERPGEPATLRSDSLGTRRGVLLRRGGADAVLETTAVVASARSVVGRVYLLLIGSLLFVYALIVVALELYVLPSQIYGPIRRMLRADEAVQRRETARELIPEDAIPSDELGEIMRSRNASVRELRRQEAALARALEQLETVATDLKRKNHLLENARRNLEGADRLASLGMMSAGIAHELNTPLAVAKGLVQRLEAGGAGALSDREAALLVRVIGRLERLGESLLDFARARPPESRDVAIAGVVAEAITLVSLDRKPERVRIENAVDPSLIVPCDGDRMVQVFVNLIRNAVDAIREHSGTLYGHGHAGEVVVTADRIERDGDVWVGVRIRDNGPGVDPEVLPRLFEPFVSSRLDARGTGLGLAVAEGIVREHGGTLIARNRADGPGAEFEILLPASERAGAERVTAEART